MTDAGFFRGTSAEQDNRFSDKEKKLMKQMKFGNNLGKKVDMNRVKLDILKPWITQRITDMLGMEDDVVIEFVFNQLEEKNPDPRKMQINLTGFLNGKNARIFMQELWDLLFSASEHPSGIPQCMVDQKKEEIRRRNKEQQLFEARLNSERDRIDRQVEDHSVDRRRDRRDRRSRSRSSSSDRHSSRRCSPHYSRARSPDRQERSLTTSSRRSPDRQERSLTTSSRRSPDRQERSLTTSSRCSPDRQERSLTTSSHRSPDRLPAADAEQPSDLLQSATQLSQERPHETRDVSAAETASQPQPISFSTVDMANGAKRKRASRWDHNNEPVDTANVPVRSEEKHPDGVYENISSESKKNVHSKRNYRSNKEDDAYFKSHKPRDGERHHSVRRSAGRHRQHGSDERRRREHDRGRSRRRCASPQADGDGRHSSRRIVTKTDERSKGYSHRSFERSQDISRSNSDRCLPKGTSVERVSRRVPRLEHGKGVSKRGRRESSSVSSSTSTDSGDATESTEEESGNGKRRVTARELPRKHKRRESVSSSSGSSEDSSDDSTDDSSGSGSSGENSDSSGRSVSSLEQDLDKLERKLRAKALQSMLRAEQEGTARGRSNSGNAD